MSETTLTLADAALIKTAIEAHLAPLKTENAALRRKLDAMEQRQSATAKEVAAIARKVG